MGVFLTQGWNQDLLHCRQILNHLRHQGRPDQIHKCYEKVHTVGIQGGTIKCYLLRQFLFMSLILNTCPQFKDYKNMLVMIFLIHITELHTKSSHCLVKNELGDALWTFEGSEPAEIQDRQSFLNT